MKEEEKNEKNKNDNEMKQNEEKENNFIKKEDAPETKNLVMLGDLIKI